MAIKVSPRWQKYLPYFDIFINVPLIRVQMIINEDEPINDMGRTYIGLQWEIWKWTGKVKVYQIGSRFIAPRGVDEDVKELGCGCFISPKWKVKKFCDKHFAEI